MPYYVENCNAGEAVSEVSAAPGSENFDESQRSCVSGPERKRKVNQLGLQWLLNLIERVRRVHTKVFVQDTTGKFEALLLQVGIIRQVHTISVC